VQAAIQTSRDSTVHAFVKKNLTGIDITLKGIQERSFLYKGRANITQRMQFKILWMMVCLRQH